MVVTFYSFKGGVGRSMAVVNVAEILASRGYRVIVADWDLEAPGLERYLLSPDTGADEYRRQLDTFLTRDGIIDLLRDYKASLTKPARPDRETSNDFAHLGKLLVRRPSSIAIPIPGEGRQNDALRFLPAGRRDGEWQDKYGETVRSFDWDEFYERWAGDAYVDFVRRDIAGERRAGVAGAADLLLIDSRTGVTEQGGVCTHDLADLVLLFSAANVTNLEDTRWMAKALAQPRLVEARGRRPLQLLPVAARIEQTSQKEELVDFRARFLQALREYVPTSLGSADAFAIETEIPYMPFYAFNERVVAREPVSRREQKLYAVYANIADAIVQVGSAGGLLDVRGGPSEPRRVRTRIARVEPPKEPIILTHEEADGPAAEKLAARLRAAGATVAARFQWNRVQRIPQFDRMLATCEGLIALVGAEGITPLLSGDLAAARRRAAVNPRFQSAVVLAPDAPATTSQAWSGPALPYPPEGEPSDDFIQDVLAILTSPAARGWEETPSPYIGLRPFAEDDARFFFGRDGAVNEIITLAESVGIGRARWIWIEGFAGAGKSSLAFAGVVPAIRRGLLTGSADPIRLAIFRPGPDPIAPLYSALTPLDPEDEQSHRQILESLRSDENTITRLIRRHPLRWSSFSISSNCSARRTARPSNKLDVCLASRWKTAPCDCTW